MGHAVFAVPEEPGRYVIWSSYVDAPVTQLLTREEVLFWFWWWDRVNDEYRDKLDVEAIDLADSAGSSTRFADEKSLRQMVEHQLEPWDDGYVRGVKSPDGEEVSSYDELLDILRRRREEYLPKSIREYLNGDSGITLTLEELEGLPMRWQYCLVEILEMLGNDGDKGVD